MDARPCLKDYSLERLRERLARDGLPRYRADQVAASGSFGFLPLLVGTILISIVALLIAVPVGLISVGPDRDQTIARSEPF